MMRVSRLLIGYGLRWWFVRVQGVVWVNGGSIMVWVRHELVACKGQKCDDGCFSSSKMAIYNVIVARRTSLIFFLLLHFSSKQT